MSAAQGERFFLLKDSRKQIDAVPCDTLFELPGRPQVTYMLKDWSSKAANGNGSSAEGEARAAAAPAREHIGFLFKAFESGHQPPRRLSKLSSAGGGDAAAAAPRAATIHEYLDYTVTALEAADETEYDFSGFRVLLLYSRARTLYPPPNGTLASAALAGTAAAIGAGGRPNSVALAAEIEAAAAAPPPPPPEHPPELGAPKPPLPLLAVNGRPLTAATVRAGPGYLELPFVATTEGKRGRGYGRCVVEAAEALARAVQVPRLLLCSTNDPQVRATWRALGFVDTSPEDMERFGVRSSDLLHLTNTVQMHKDVPPARAWRAVVVRHGAFAARAYAPADGGGGGAGEQQRRWHGGGDGATPATTAGGAGMAISSAVTLSAAADASGWARSEQQTAGGSLMLCSSGGGGGGGGYDEEGGDGAGGFGNGDSYRAGGSISGGGDGGTPASSKRARTEATDGGGGGGGGSAMRPASSAGTAPASEPQQPPSET